ncbi:hypothetical protein [Kribbella sindirgiensis]|nr:hypothetical protein [Kribbella sindirgiensis]
MATRREEAQENPADGPVLTPHPRVVVVSAAFAAYSITEAVTKP